MATDVKNGHRQHLINRILGWLPRFMVKNMKFQITISVELPIQMIPNHGAIPLIQFRVVQEWSSKNIISWITENSPISDVRFDYCDIDSSCKKCGTVTKSLGYKYDIFNAIGDKLSSFSPTTAPTISKITKIFGGRQVEAGEVPWQVNLLYPTGDSCNHCVKIGYQYYYSFCGGVVISTTKVISAAHCLMSSDDGSLKSADDILVIAGHSSIRTARQISGLEKYVLHP